MENFSVFLSGTKSNSESGREALKNSLVEVLCLEHEEAENMVKDFPTEVEGHLSRESAQALAEILESLGAMTEIRNVLGQIIIETEITPYVDTTPSPSVEINEEEESLEEALENALALLEGSFQEEDEESKVDESKDNKDQELEQAEDNVLDLSPTGSISNDLCFSDDSETLNSNDNTELDVPIVNEVSNHILSNLNFEEEDQISSETIVNSEPSTTYLGSSNLESSNFNTGPEKKEAELVDTSLLDLSLSFEDEVIENKLNLQVKSESFESIEESSLELGGEEYIPDCETPIIESNESTVAKNFKESILQDARENEALDNAFREKMQKEMLSTKAARIEESMRLSKSHKTLSQNAPVQKTQEIVEEKEITPAKTKRPTGRLSREELSIDDVKAQKKNQTLLAVLTFAVLVLMYLFMPSDTKDNSSDVINPELVKVLLQAQKKQTVEIEETPDPNRKRTFEALLNNVSWKNKTSVISIAGGLSSLDLEFTVHKVPMPEPEEYLKKEFKPHLVSLALNFQTDSPSNMQMAEQVQLGTGRLYVQDGTERKRLTSPMIIRFDQDGKLLKLVSSESEEMLAPGTYFIEKSSTGDLVLKMHLIIPLKETAPIEIIRSTKGINKESEEKVKDSSDKKSKKAKKKKKQD